MNDAIVLRANGGAAIGLGHVVRAASLIPLLPAGRPVIFVVNREVVDFATRLATPLGCTAVRSVEYEEYADGELGELRDVYLGARLAVVDGYAFTSNYLRRLGDLAGAVLYVDDLANRPLPVDLVVNHAPGFSVDDYSLGFGTILRTGPANALLRPAFAAQSTSLQEGAAIPNQREGLFICMGGADINNLTADYVDLVRDLGYKGRIAVVLGASSTAAIRRATHSASGDVETFVDLPGDELARLMVTCRRAIVPSSGILLECLATGLEVATGFYVDNQERVFRGYADLGCVYPLGDLNDIKAARMKLASFFLNGGGRLERSPLSLGIANSSRRLKRDLGYLTEDFAIRPAVFDDADLLFAWRADPETVLNSRSGDIPQMDAHRVWLRAVLADPQRRLTIVAYRGRPIAQMRIDVEADRRASVTISLEAASRGKGLSAHVYQRALRDSLPWLRARDVRSITALVRAGNEPSVRLHESVGFATVHQGGGFVTMATAVPVETTVLSTANRR